MRHLLLSDVHANANALEAVLAHARLQRWDDVVFLGDAVGYYPEPERAVTMLAELAPRVGLLGNHDAALLALARDEPPEREAGVVLDILRRHLDELSAESLAYLEGLAERAVEDGWEAVHGGLRTPWEYLTTLQRAQANLPLMQTRLCLFGHTHVPRVYAAVETPSGEMWRTVSFRDDRNHYRIPPRARALANPGSVGQPRDGIPLASYGILDEASGTLDVFRVEYDLLGVQRQVRAKGYPEVLAKRLTVGK